MYLFDGDWEEWFLRLRKVGEAHRKQAKDTMDDLTLTISSENARFLLRMARQYKRLLTEMQGLSAVDFHGPKGKDLSQQQMNAALRFISHLEYQVRHQWEYVEAEKIE